MYYLETRISPHGQRSVVGGQAPDGRPLVTYSTLDGAAAAVGAARRSLPTTAMNDRGQYLIREVSVRLTADLRAPGYSHYVTLVRLSRPLRHL